MSPPVEPRLENLRSLGKAMHARCLIVEDDPLQAEGLKSLVEYHGHSVCGIASSADDAVTLAEAAHPDIALIDIGLDGPADGIEAAERIRRAHACRLVFITGRHDPRALARISLLGILILHKPIDPALIAGLLSS
jgi:DNA-binding NarL/FixJ family response regulator